MIKKVLVSVFLTGAFLFVYFRYFHPAPAPQVKNPVPTSEIYPSVSYTASSKTVTSISIFNDQIITPTRLKISPDGKYLFVTNLTGSLYVFAKTGASWDKHPLFLTSVDTHFPGFPPEEAGLTGFIFSHNYAQNGKIFLLYTYKDKDNKVKNRISVTTISKTLGSLSAARPRLIYQANFDGSPSHQITDGLGIDINGAAHLLVLVGEGFDASRAQDPHLEAGKVILIKEDGGNPDGTRPFPENPKVQAMGIRNAFVLAPVPNTDRLLIADTGPDKYDRLIYLPQPSADHNPALNLGWDGTQEKLAKPIPDPDNKKIKDLVIDRLPETRTFTGLAFLPESSPDALYLLATMFGKTGSNDNLPGKQIWLGKITNLSAQPQITFTPIITRTDEADKKLGNPIGLALDQNNNFFFADVLESRIYFVTTSFEGR